MINLLIREITFRLFQCTSLQSITNVRPTEGRTGRWTGRRHSHSNNALRVYLLRFTVLRAVKRSKYSKCLINGIHCLIVVLNVVSHSSKYC